MKKIKKIFDLLPLMVMWLVLSVFVWGCIFNFLTDTDAEKKIALFIDAPVPGATELAVALEEAGISDAIDMVKVHPFTYAMMAESGLATADLYIVRASNVENYRDWFCPLPEEMAGAGETLTLDGVSLGVKVYDHASGQGTAASCIAYDRGDRAGEDCYLCFGSSSLHVGTNAGAVDDLAVEYARVLLNIP